MNRLRHRVTSIAFLLVFSWAPRAWANAWTVPRNKIYAEYYYRYYGAKKDFDRAGNSHRKPNVGMFSDIRNEWKLEYGLTDWWNVMASVPYQSSHYRDDNIDRLTTGVGDIYVRTKLRLLEKPVVGSVQFSWKIPGGYDRHESPALGKGQVDFESRLLVSRAFLYGAYPVRVHRKDAADHPQQSASSPTGDILVSLSAREEAMRRAIVTAALYKQGQRLLREGRASEAATWFRAVLENEPRHDEARRLLSELMPEAEAAMPPPEVILARAETTELAPPEPEIETRYAGVAFVNVEGAFTGRRGEPANEFPIYLEAGVTPFQRFMVVGNIETVLSVRSTHEQVESFAKWGVRGVWNVKGDGFSSVFKTGRANVNLEVGYNDVFAGHNTGDAFEVFGKVGVSF